VVDDNPVNIKVICGYLKKLGVVPDCADSGQGALQRVITTAQHYDLIFMDCEMPGIDGYDATSQIRRWEQQQGLLPHAICALSAHAMQRYRERCLEVGMNDFMSKPIVLDELKAVLSRFQPLPQSSEHVL
jgi:CheY-like chemotaxis protein